LRDEGRVRFTGDPAMPDPKDDEDEADEESDEGEDKL
jgi:hypothetical protein